jgi:transglutaminase-like putative cysteine protease
MRRIIVSGRLLVICAAALLALGACGGDKAKEDATASPGTGSAQPASSGGSKSPAKRVYTFTYEAQVPAPPAGTKRLRAWVPLPAVEPGVQEVANLELLSPKGGRETKDAETGTRFLYAEVENPTAGIEMRWSARVTRFEDQGQGRATASPLYLREEPLIPLGDEAKGIVKELGIDAKGMATRDKAQKIYDDVLGDMTYDKKEPGWGQGDFQRAITVCKGNCCDFHARFLGVGRTAGIPIRFTMGVPFPTGKDSYNGYHCWAHFLDDATKSWVPVDISEADKVAEKDPEKARWFFGHLDPNRITLSYGFHVNLEPRQEGPPLRYVVYPYAEADGKKVEMDNTMWKFSWVDQP